VRAADDSRPRKAQELARRWEAGYLSLSTFEVRVLAAYTARTPAQLSRLTEDLPPSTLAEAARRIWRWLAGTEDSDDAIVLSPPPETARGPGGLLLGRDERCHLVLDDPTVSRRHVRLWQREGSWSIEDLRSTNGTRVNGWRIDDARGHDGDRLVLGGAELVFRER
jgi:FHA domain-containing protein/uncharacterized protein DUF1707